MKLRNTWRVRLDLVVGMLAFFAIGTVPVLVAMHIHSIGLFFGGPLAVGLVAGYKLRQLFYELSQCKERDAMEYQKLRGTRAARIYAGLD